VAWGGEAGHAGADLGEQVPGGGDADAGISSSWATWAANGAMAAPIRLVRVPIRAVSASIRAGIMPGMNAW
jgi:hypothetical protein